MNLYIKFPRYMRMKITCYCSFEWIMGLYHCGKKLLAKMKTFVKGIKIYTNWHKLFLFFFSLSILSWIPATMNYACVYSKFSVYDAPRSCTSRWSLMPRNGDINCNSRGRVYEAWKSCKRYMYIPIDSKREYYSVNV